MPANVSKLNQKQLKVREQFSQDYENTLTKEQGDLNKYQARVGDRLNTSPSVKPLDPASALTDLEVRDYQKVIGQLLMRVEGLALDYKSKLSVLDREWMKRHP